MADREKLLVFFAFLCIVIALLSSSLVSAESLKKTACQICGDNLKNKTLLYGNCFARDGTQMSDVVAGRFSGKVEEKKAFTSVNDIMTKQIKDQPLACLAELTIPGKEVSELLKINSIDCSLELADAKLGSLKLGMSPKVQKQSSPPLVDTLAIGGTKQKVLDRNLLNPPCKNGDFMLGSHDGKVALGTAEQNSLPEFPLLALFATIAVALLVLGLFVRRKI